MALQKCENQDQSSKYSPVKTASVFEPCSGWKYKKPLDGMWHILTFKSDRFCLHQRGLSLKEQNQSVQPLQTHSHSAFSGLAYLPELIFFLFFSFLPRSFCSGAADVSAFLWNINFQCQVVFRVSQRVRQESGKRRQPHVSEETKQRF